jgi:hypothetical protein
MTMEWDSIKDAMKFFNWEMITAIAILITAWVQLLKRYLPEEYPVGKCKIPVIVLVAFASGFVFSHIIFDISGVKHSETIALFHGFAGTLFSLLGYELLSGKLFSLRSANDMRNGGK